MAWRKATLLLVILALVGCAHPGGTTYRPEEAGQAMRVDQAQVLSSREVLISGLGEGQASGWGAAIGAALAGTAAYGITGGNSTGDTAITVISAITGGLAGLAAEERRQTRPGVEYILRRSDGEELAVVQSRSSGEEIFPPGSRVSLIRSRDGFTRVVPPSG